MGIPITTSPPGHGLNQGMQRLAEPEGEPAGGHVSVGAAACGNRALLRHQQRRGERPGVEDLDPPVMEARWHFGATQGSSSGGPGEVAVPGGAGSLPQPSSPLPFSLHRVAMPAFSYSSPLLPLPQHAASRGAAGAPQSEGPWAPQGCQGLGHGPRGTGTRGTAGGRCWWPGLAPPPWHLFDITGRFGPTLRFGVALGDAPGHAPVSQRPPCCPSLFPRGTPAGLGGNSAWLRCLWDTSETCCSLRLTSAKPPSHARRAASYWKVFNWALCICVWL